MAITLTPDLQDLVEEKLRSGQYPTASDVLRVALQLLDERDRVYRARLDELRAEIRKGLDSGEPMEAGTLLAELHAKG
ncbi:MAG: type II toxin-antitoxin system ParD family antitoxin [Candidatus Binatia bacterium]